MLLSDKRNNSPPSILLNYQPLEFVQQYKYFGVILSSNLCWSSHIQHIICSKGRKGSRHPLPQYLTKHPNTNNRLTIMKLYVAQVRSASVESPSAKDINYLEMVQKFGIRICSKDYHESYQNLLDFYTITSEQEESCFCVYVPSRTCVFPK